MADLRNTLDPKDFRYIKDQPDPGFSVERNQAVIEDSIRKTNKFFAQDGEAIKRSMGERVDILSSYAIYRFNKGTKDFIGYYGRDNYHKLVGEKIMSKVRIADTVNKLNGNNRFKKGILL